MERWVDEIEGWETRSVPDGYHGLRSLADESFSGAVSAGGTWLFFVNGRAVGVFEYRQRPSGAEVSRGDVERFEDAALTAYEAPHPSIPLLVAMQAGDTETRGQYYTEDTPIREVHATLEDGGFTGYLELSENVLSGDYYVLYQGGRSMEVAFIGNSRRLETDEDAFERASDEVGIYEVVSTDLDVVDIPDPEPDETAAVAAAEVDAQDTDEEPTADAEPDEPTDTDAEPDAEPAEPGPDAEPEPTTDDADDAVPDEPTDENEDDGTVAAATTAVDDGTEPDASSQEPVTEPEPATDAADTEGESAAVDDRDPLADTAAGASGGGIVDHEVPSLDPERSGVDGDGSGGETTEPRGAAATVQRDRADAEPGRAAELERRLEEREADLEEARAELGRVREERDDLRERVAELEAELAELRAAAEPDDEADDGGGADETLSPAAALSGTNLFVRYRSKGKTTLRDVHGGDGGLEALSENLRLEHHTEFDDAAVTVDGEPFEAWLHDSQPFRFLRWLTTTLPFEVRETGATDGMAALYDALPEIDRVELGGSVELPGDDGPHELDFDIVVRDRMGEPLAVCELDGSREPVSEGQLARLVNDASDIAEREETLAGAFFVTGSFFDPDALETAREATSGSLLSRDKRRSFVKLSRKRGYHLCLVESRDGDFNLSVPDL